jgi:hypothetical protein
MDMFEQTEVVVIDAPGGAAWALGGYRPRHERTHLICRWPDELLPAFVRRVLKQLARVTRGAQLATLTLVLGDPDFSRLLAELGHDLGAAIAPTGSFNLMGVGASQSDLVASVELLRHWIAPSVTLNAWFSPKAEVSLLK